MCSSSKQFRLPSCTKQSTKSWTTMIELPSVLGSASASVAGPRKEKSNYGATGAMDGVWANWPINSIATQNPWNIVSLSWANSIAARFDG